MLRSFTALWNDFHNLSASLAKIRLYHASRTNKEYGIYRFVQSEIEYLAILCRSIFDVLRVVLRLHIANVRCPVVFRRLRSPRRSSRGAFAKYSKRAVRTDPPMRSSPVISCQDPLPNGTFVTAISSCNSAQFGIG